MKTRKKLKTRKRRLRKRGGANQAVPPPPGPPVLMRQSSKIVYDEKPLLFVYPDNHMNPIPLPQNPLENYNNPLGHDGTQEYSIPENIDENIENNPLHEAHHSPCCISTLLERVTNINSEIANIDNNYNVLIERLAQHILGKYAQYIEGPTINLSLFPDDNDFKKNYIEWEKNVKNLLFGYQRLSIGDVEKALFYLLPQFDTIIDPRDQRVKLVFNEGSTIMTALIKNYSYKMITSLFTTANITTAVLMYNDTMGVDPIDDTYTYLRNLLSVMKCGSDIINEKLRVHWREYLPDAPYDRKYIYYHSGGNMIVMIAGVLCYLYEKNRVSPGADYKADILGQIRVLFDTILGQSAVLFYTWLNLQMIDPEFKQNLYSCTENLSDLDFIFFAPTIVGTDTVQNLDTPFLTGVNRLSARIIREIVISSCDLNRCARVLMPFHGHFDGRWPDFKYCSMIANDNHPVLVPLQEPCLSLSSGYRQTSNRIDAVPMYLNRLKQGYLPFYDIHSRDGIPDIPDNLREIYAGKYGECIDLSIGTLQSLFYSHKHHNYQHSKYYSIETILWELKQILAKTFDDKTPKRQMRMNFLMKINTIFIDILFRVIAYFIQNYNMTEEEKNTMLDEIIGLVPFAAAEYTAMTAAAEILSRERTQASTASATAAEVSRAAASAEDARDAMRARTHASVMVEKAKRAGALRDVSETIIKSFANDIGVESTTRAEQNVAVNIDAAVNDVVSREEEVKASATAAVQEATYDAVLELTSQDRAQPIIIEMAADIAKKALSKEVGEISVKHALSQQMLVAIEAHAKSLAIAEQASHAQEEAIAVARQAPQDAHAGQAAHDAIAVSGQAAQAAREAKSYTDAANVALQEVVTREVTDATAGLAEEARAQARAQGAEEAGEQAVNAVQTVIRYGLEATVKSALETAFSIIYIHYFVKEKVLLSIAQAREIAYQISHSSPNTIRNAHAAALIIYASEAAAAEAARAGEEAARAARDEAARAAAAQAAADEAVRAAAAQAARIQDVKSKIMTPSNIAQKSKKNTAPKSKRTAIGAKINRTKKNKVEQSQKRQR